MGSCRRPAPPRFARRPYPFSVRSAFFSGRADRPCLVIQGPPVSRRRVVRLFVLLILLGLWFFPALVTLITDWWFFREIGYQAVFTREIETRSLLFVLVGGVASAFLYFNLRMAQRGLAPVPFHLPLAGGAAGLLNLTALVRRAPPPFTRGAGGPIRAWARG